MFLACWLPYDNGLRPEPVVVVLSLLALCAVEYAVATHRLAPAALGLLTAAFAVGVNPHGMVAALPFLAAAKPLLLLVRRRAARFGWTAVLAPIAASGVLVLVAAFSDQPWQAAFAGFAPGFVYLAGGHPSFRVPRRKSRARSG